MARFSSKQDVLDQDIIPALGSYAADYDVDAIFQEAFDYRTDTDDNGNVLLNTAGFEQVVDVEGFWEIAEAHDNS